jgi:hypothetical protein
MIYLHFEIQRDSFLDLYRPQIATAEFMILSQDSEEATARARAELRNAGWQATALTGAHQGTTPDDFPLHYRTEKLFQRAVEKGIAWAVSAQEPLEAPEGIPVGATT